MSSLSFDSHLTSEKNTTSQKNRSERLLDSFFNSENFLKEL